MVAQIDGDDEDQYFPVLKSNTNKQANHADIKDINREPNNSRTQWSIGVAKKSHVCLIK
jgi:hypothetical protein